MTNLVNPILYTVASINLILSFVIFSRGFKDFKNILFALITLGTAFWSSAIIGFYSVDFSQSINWIILTHTSALFIAVIFFYFTLFFPQTLLKDKFVQIIFSLPFLTITYFIIFTEKIISGGNVNLTYDIHRGYLFYSFFVAAYFFGGYYFLYRQYIKATTEDERQQIKYVLFGSFLASTLAIVPDLILPYLGIFTFTWLGPLCTLIMVFSIFIAMLKFKLFNIRIIVTEIFAGLIIIVQFVELFLANSTQDLIINAVVLVILSIFSFLLIKAVYKEVEQREKIEELSDQKSEFMSFAAHELRNPLTSIKGITSEILEGDFGDISPVLKDAAGKIFIRSNDVVQLIQQYLDKSKFELEQIQYQMDIVNLKDITAKLIEDFKHHLELHKAVIEFNADNGPHLIYADKGKIQEVVGNLIDNSIKYSPDNSHIKISLTRNAGMIALHITDNGIGISKEVQGKLFQKFARAADARKVNIKGSGLGLYLAKQFMEGHKGRIWVESEGEGKGSTFSIELPAAPETKA